MIVSGPRIGIMPVSRVTVTVHIKFEPDIGAKYSDSITIIPKSAAGSQGGVIRFTEALTLPRGSNNGLTKTLRMNWIFNAYENNLDSHSSLMRLGSKLLNQGITSIADSDTIPIRTSDRTPSAHSLPSEIINSVGKRCRSWTPVRYFRLSHP